MVDQNTLVVVMLGLVLSDFVKIVAHGRVFSSRLKLEDDSVSVLEWKTLDETPYKRFKRNIISDRLTRDTTSFNGNTNDTKLISSKFIFPDKSHSQAVVSWSGSDNSVVFILTRQKSDLGYGFVSTTLWRSGDFGTTFTKINFPQNAIPEMIYKSSANRAKTILTDLTHYTLYITENNGLNWTTVNLDFEPFKLFLHPTLENWLLAYNMFDLMLFVSSDFGKTWKLLRKDVNMKIFWAVENVDSDILTVHMETYDTYDSMMAEYVSCIAPNCVDNTLDRSVGDLDPLSLHVDGDYIFIQKSTLSTKELYISYKRRPFRKAYFPLNVHPNDFHIIDTRDNQVFLAADHQENDVILYLSDVTGQFYVTSLEHVIADRENGYLEADIYHIRGIKGRYVANQYIDKSMTKSRTKITFNKGVTWSDINVPDQEKAQCDSKQACSLHLHLSYSYTYFAIPRIESEFEAPWLILAHGIVGENLKPSNASLFISRDGGLNWNKAGLEEGVYKLNVIDQGGAITAVKYTDEDLNDIINFSVDEGHSWQKYKFLDEEMYVDDVLNSPRIATLSVSVFGRLKEQKGRLMVKLDFSKILDRKCDANDYGDWNPGAGISEQFCILGQSVVYKRRHTDSLCQNGKNYIRRNTTSTCLCKDEDFQCDYGFVRTATGTCATADWYSPSKIHWHCKEGESFNKTKGYRKIVGDKCVGGVEGAEKYKPITVNCTVVQPGGLRLSTKRTILALGENVTFSLSQKRGSVLSTAYIWTFGDGTANQTDIGLSKAGKKYHKFSKPGIFNISVVAKNQAGTAVCTVIIRVEAAIKGVIVLTPYGAEVNQKTLFNVSLLGRREQTDFGHTHYAWKFGDEGAESEAYLTWSPTVSHVYNKTGRYNVTLDAVNHISSVRKQFVVYVYNKITTIRLHFTKDIDHFSSEKFNWRYEISQDIRVQLSESLYVQSHRLIVSIPQITPTIADVTILPNKVGGPTEDQVVFELQQKVINQQIRFSFFQLMHPMVVESMEVVRGNKPANSSGPSTLTPSSHQHVPPVEAKSSSSSLSLYVALPAVVIVVAILVAVTFVCIRQRKHKKDQRYSLIMNRQLGVTMLGDEDDDDDFIGGGENIFESPDGDNSVIFNTPQESTLVMFSGSNAQDNNLNWNC